MLVFHLENKPNAVLLLHYSFFHNTKWNVKRTSSPANPRSPGCAVFSYGFPVAILTVLFSRLPSPIKAERSVTTAPLKLQIKVYDTYTQCSFQLDCSSLILKQSLTATFTLWLHWCARTQAGCSLHCPDCVQPCLLYPLSRHNQEASSQYEAGRRSIYTSRDTTDRCFKITTFDENCLGKMRQTVAWWSSSSGFM